MTQLELSFRATPAPRPLLVLRDIEEPVPGVLASAPVHVLVRWRAVGKMQKYNDPPRRSPTILDEPTLLRLLDRSEDYVRVHVDLGGDEGVQDRVLWLDFLSLWGRGLIEPYAPDLWKVTEIGLARLAGDPRS